MKAALYILLLFSAIGGFGGSAYGQASNRPELARRLCNQFVTGATDRGIEVRGRLLEVGKILFLEDSENSHVHKDGECVICINTPRLPRQQVGGTVKGEISWELKRKFLHELGHHYGLSDCRHCTYNIMAAFQMGRSVFLFEDEAVRRLYIDLFFEQLRDPSKPHKHY